MLLRFNFIRIIYHPVKSSITWQLLIMWLLSVTKDNKSLNFKGELDSKIDFSSFKHLGIVEQLYEGFFKLLVEQVNCNESTNLIGGSIVLSAVVYNVGYDIRMIKTRKNMFSVRLLAAIKEKQVCKT